MLKNVVVQIDFFFQYIDESYEFYTFSIYVNLYKLNNASNFQGDNFKSNFNQFQILNSFEF